ncbi:MAG: ABC transporter permease [Actinomycetota bacterium]|nr:ABC transporter permease [Actinomycetota bacterium]
MTALAEATRPASPAPQVDADSDVSPRARHPGALRRFRRRPVALAALAVLALVVAVAAIGGRLWRYHYADITPHLSMSPSWSHPMGTDGVGHDMLARVLRGTQRSLQVGIVVAIVSTAFGVAVGAIGGYCRGLVDAAVMRFTDMVLTVPGIAILAVLAGWGGTKGNWLAISLVVAALSWMGIARVVRGLVLVLREQQFVEAARAAGAGPRRIVASHILPHAAGPVIVKATFTVGAAILAESGLSYLGLGISPPDTSLGLLIASGEPAASTRPWLFYFPGLMIALIVLSVNLVGDALRDAFDPTDEGARHARASRCRKSSEPAQPTSAKSA